MKQRNVVDASLDVCSECRNFELCIIEDAEMVLALKENGLGMTQMHSNKNSNELDISTDQ
jgi:hypothetical protein